jgi:hypothetical protein
MLSGARKLVRFYAEGRRQKGSLSGIEECSSIEQLGFESLRARPAQRLFPTKETGAFCCVPQPCTATSCMAGSASNPAMRPSRARRLLSSASVAVAALPS